jgi:hypothetical protein
MGFSMFSDDFTHPEAFFIHAVETIPEPTLLASALNAKNGGIVGSESEI